MDDPNAKTELIAAGPATLPPQPPPAPTVATTPPYYTPPSAIHAVRVGRPERMWTVALAAALLVTVGGLGFLYLDDSSFQNSTARLTRENAALKSQKDTLKTQLDTTQANLTATLGELATVRAELDHPHLEIWNVAQTIKGSTWYLLGGIPDTFTYHLKATSTGPMSVSILTHEDLAKAFNCVDNGVSNSNYCMHHSGQPVRSWLNVTSVNYDFHGAEGCADYIAVFTAAGTVTVKPDVSVTYNPAATGTGTCA
jgi:hypothetical protein